MENANVTYSYDIYYLNVSPSENGMENVVKSVNWRYQIREESHFADEYLLTELTPADSNKFIQYDNLSHATVFSWIQSAINLNELQEKLKLKLEQNKNPILVEKAIPWIPDELYTGQEEYLLVFDNDVEKHWGPMQWNSERANNGLKHYGVNDYEFPHDITMYQKELLPTDESKVVNDRVKLYRVEYTEQPNLNELTHYNEGLSWVLDSGKAVGTYLVHERPIEDIQNILIDQVIQKRQLKAIENLVEFEVNGVVHKFNSTIESRVQLFLIPEAADGSIFVTAEREYLALTKQQLNQLNALIHQRHQNILNLESQKVLEIKSATTVDQLKALEI